MTRFHSTRGGVPVPFVEALFGGLAPDGGLYLPVAIGRLGERPGGGAGRARPDLSETPLSETAGDALTALLGDGVEAGTLRAVVRRALDFPAPLVEVEEGIHLLELFHGPSLAFKDVGARFMAEAMAALGGEERERTVLVATSGDTGGAVARAFHGREGYRVVVLFPADGVSEVQRRQMTTLGGNVAAVSVDGTFDDCQRLAKGAFADPELHERAGLTSANSINVGRLLPQATYYVHAARALGPGVRPTFVVPSGNLGNLCAGLLAHRAGMPAAGFVAALNANRAFADYLATGRYEPRASVPTVSNAMDVGAPSNLERIRRLYDDDLEALRADVRAGSCDDAETLRTISGVHARTGVTLDPHAAVGYALALRLREELEGPVVVLATAHPAKFGAAVADAIGEPVPLPEPLAEAMGRPESVRAIAPDPGALREILATPASAGSGR